MVCPLSHCKAHSELRHCPLDWAGDQHEGVLSAKTVEVCGSHDIDRKSSRTCGRTWIRRRLALARSSRKVCGGQPVMCQHANFRIGMQGRHRVLRFNPRLSGRRSSHTLRACVSVVGRKLARNPGKPLRWAVGRHSSVCKASCMSWPSAPSGPVFVGPSALTRRGDNLRWGAVGTSWMEASANCEPLRARM